MGEEEASPGLGYGTMHPHELWASVALQLDGEETVGRCNCLQYLLLAELILVFPLLSSAVTPNDPSWQSTKANAAATETSRSDGNHESLISSFQSDLVSHVASRLPSWIWWSIRVTSLHQQLLAGKSPTLLSRVGALTEILQAWIQAPSGTEPDTPSPLQGCPDLQGALSMELALIQYRYGHVELALKLLVQSGQALGLEVELSGKHSSFLSVFYPYIPLTIRCVSHIWYLSYAVLGAMGKRTAFQVDAKAQLVVLATRSRVSSSDSDPYDVGFSREQMGLGSRGGGDTLGGREEDVYVAPVLISEEGRVRFL